MIASTIFQSSREPRQCNLSPRDDLKYFLRFSFDRLNWRVPLSRIQLSEFTEQPKVSFPLITRVVASDYQKSLFHRCEGNDFCSKYSIWNCLAPFKLNDARSISRVSNFQSIQVLDFLDISFMVSWCWWSSRAQVVKSFFCDTASSPKAFYNILNASTAEYLFRKQNLIEKLTFVC